MQDKRIALVTGANQGVGLQVAKELVAHGLTVLVGSRNFEKGQAAAKQIGMGAHALQLDVTDQASITAAAERIRNEFGRLDVLVKYIIIFYYALRSVLSHSVEDRTSACLGNTFSVRTRCTSSSRSAHRSDNTVSM